MQIPINCAATVANRVLQGIPWLCHFLPMQMSLSLAAWTHPTRLSKFGQVSAMFPSSSAVRIRVRIGLRVRFGVGVGYADCDVVMPGVGSLDHIVSVRCVDRIEEIG